MPAEPNIADKVRSFITDYVSLPSDAYADIAALYVLHTHAFNSARTTPYLYVTSHGPGSGKTRVLEVMSEVCRQSVILSGVTGPAMFTLIEARRPTLMVDEVDTIYSGAKDEALRSVLNSGYKHNGRVARVDKSAEDGIRDYSTFCPKILAGIDNGQVPDTVMDRSIVIKLEKAARGTVQPFYVEDVEELAEDLKDEIRAWYAANSDELSRRENRPAALHELSDRQNDIARPLITIADRIPGWGKRARNAFVRVFTAQDTPLTPQVLALMALRDWFDIHPDAEKISSADAAQTAGHTGKQLGVWFKAFGVPSTGTYSIDGKVAKGYRRTDFTDAFARFIPERDDDSTEATE